MSPIRIGSAADGRRATGSSTDAAVAERATRTAYDNLQLERAAESARRWLALVPDSEVARRYLATSLLRVYDEDGAAEQFTQLLQTSYTDRARGYLVLLGILSGEDNDTGAARVMDRLAAGDLQQHRGAADRFIKVFEHVEKRRLCPMNVIEQRQHGALCGEPLHKAAHTPVNLVQRKRRSAEARCRSHPISNLGVTSARKQLLARNVWRVLALDPGG